MKWYIGQDVVCIRTHSKNVIKKGDIFTIKGLKQGCCSVDLDVNISADSNTTECGYCHKVEQTNGMYWFSEELFAPLESITDITEIEELLKQPIFQL